MIYANTRITFDISGSVLGTWGVIPNAPQADAVRATAIRLLDPYFIVHSVSVSDAGLFNPFYTAQAVLTVRGSYSELDDVKSVVRSAFWTAAGNVPTVTAPEYGDTPQPATPVGPFDQVKSIALIAVVGLALVVVLQLQR